MNKEKYLPVGSVVLLKNAKKRVMVTGFAARGRETGERIFDYMGCLYPEGVVSSEKNLLFDHNQIDQIFYMGYVDEEWKIVEEKLKNIVSKISGENTEVKEIEQPQEQTNISVQPQTNVSNENKQQNAGIFTTLSNINNN